MVQRESFKARAKIQSAALNQAGHENVRTFPKTLGIHRCARDVSILLKERNPKNFEELDQMAKQYLKAHNKNLLTEEKVAGQDIKDTKLAGSGDQGDIMRCFVCDSKNYKAVYCPRMR